MTRWIAECMVLAAAAMVLMAGQGSPKGRAAGPDRSPFMTVCDSNAQVNVPLSTAEQRRQFCECRFDRLSERLSPQDLATVTEALVDSREEALPTALFNADNEATSGCAEQAFLREWGN